MWVKRRFRERGPVSTAREFLTSMARCDRLGVTYMVHETRPDIRCITCRTPPTASCAHRRPVLGKPSVCASVER